MKKTTPPAEAQTAMIRERVTEAERAKHDRVGGKELLRAALKRTMTTGEDDAMLDAIKLTLIGIALVVRGLLGIAWRVLLVAVPLVFAYLLWHSEYLTDTLSSLAHSEYLTDTLSSLAQLAVLLALWLCVIAVWSALLLCVAAVVGRMRAYCASRSRSSEYSSIPFAMPRVTDHSLSPSPPP